MMNRILRKMFRLLKDDSGVALIYITIAIPVIFGITSLAVDMGYVLYVKTRLQVAADMGALAGASKLYTGDAKSVKDLAEEYVNHNLPLDWTGGGKPAVSSKSEVKCLSTIAQMGLTCSSLSGGNSLKVTVSATVPLFFANALGFTTMKLSADAMVSGGGSAPPPLNVAIVLDATYSMYSSLGTSCGILANPKKIVCASLATKTLLTKLWSSVDQVALYTYPAFDPGSRDFATCKPGNSGRLNMVSYQTAGNPNYQLFGFSDSYMDTGSPPTGGLITTNDLVLALGKSASSATANDSTTCAGLATSSLGIGTSIADAIAQAQNDLIAANDALIAKGLPKRQNVLIVLSDGDANGNSTSLLGPRSPDEFIAGTDIYGTNSSSKWVIDVHRMMNQCQAAVAVADAAAAAGTWVYSVAFAAPNAAKGSCFTDRKVTTVIKTATSTPPLTSADNIIVSTRSCTSSNKCKAIAAAPDSTVTSTISAHNTSTKMQDVTTKWAESIVTTCTKADGSTTGSCTTTRIIKKLQTDQYDLKVYATTACKTMQDIASDPSKFYSTDGSNTNKCPSAANPNFTDLVAIFNNVAASIMKKRRIPSGLT